jgi:predicted nucleic acid-binding protein
MSEYLLDTTVLIDVANGLERVVRTVEAWLESEFDVVSISAVQIAEFFSGLRRDERARWRRLIEAYEIHSMTIDAAVMAGALRYDFARRGIQIAVPDALIAAVALEHGATLVTANAKDFPVRGLSACSLSESLPAGIDASPSFAAHD